MRNLLIVLVFALFLASCKKDELPKVTYPEPPTVGVVLYKIYNSPPTTPQAPEIYTRKITFLSDYTVDNEGEIIPIYRDTIVTGDFTLSFKMKPYRRLAPNPYNDGKDLFEYVMPINIGWEAVDGKFSFTKVWAGVIENGKEKKCYYGGGGCPNNFRDLSPQLILYYFPGLNNIGVYDR